MIEPAAYIGIKLYKNGQNPFFEGDDKEYYVRRIKEFLDQNKDRIGYNSELESAYYIIRINRDWENERMDKELEVLFNKIPLK